MSFRTPDGVVQAVRGVSFQVDTGQTLGIVGESGSGKSVATQTITGLTRGARISGRAMFEGRDLLALGREEMQQVRGAQIGMIFQDPLSSLHPYYRVGWQIVEAIRAHEDVSRAAARERAVEALHEVGIPSPERRVDAYPHELSGGMRQPVTIAIALACDPQLLIADQPTTALDATIQAQIMELLRGLKEERNMAMLLITHDLGVVAESADHVAIMYAGLIVESAPVKTLFAEPAHPYTRGLLACIPRLGDSRRRLVPIGGQVPSARELPPGCAFLDRCPDPFAPCRGKIPPLTEIAPGHRVRCWRAQ